MCCVKIMETLELLRLPNHTETTKLQDMFNYAKLLAANDLHLAAAGVLIALLPSVEGESKSQICRMIVTCGMVLRNVEFMKLVSDVKDPILIQKVSMLLNTTIHEKYKNKLLQSNSEEVVTLGGGPKILICAGGDNLLTQAWANIRSLRETGCELPVTIVHANEITAPQMRILSNLNITFMNLKEEPYASRLPQIPARYENLRGFQIKIAALVATDADNVILSDADILWAANPSSYLSLSDIHTFQDIWHMSNKQQSKSAGTAWLYNIHGMSTNVQETESGVIVMNRNKCTGMITTLCRMLEGIDYYFEMAFGDKDLYYIAAHVNGMKISKSSIPQMLGYLEDNEFVCQSMRQPTPGGATSHIHMTLLPFKKDQRDVICPSQFCDDTDKIRFVFRNIDGERKQTVGSTADKVIELPLDNIIPSLVFRGYLYSKEFSESMSNSPISTD